METAARVAAALVKKMVTNTLPYKIFLNINLPDLPLSEIKGIEITRLARASHINTVEEGSHGRQKYYWLERQMINDTADSGTDIRAIEQGRVSITPLYFHRSDRPPHDILNPLCADILQRLQHR
ncbi:MAG: hypothetical protein A2144_02960 [Chloroflexi bacterium RBG_16_50_9]|nr:MAG: hypothetical protein A2144_02960 [Chloroflexi bacterium RBG_16_50_9]